MKISKSILLKSLDYAVHPCWTNFIETNINILYKIEEQIIIHKNDFTPNINLVLRFLSLDLKTVKIIILGQDPYPQRGIATGRAFEVGNLKSWHQKFNNISLKNIVRAIYFAYSQNHLKYNEILHKIHDTPQLFNEDRFSILPPCKLFEDWEKQGVLLLNTAFTCRIGEPVSHSEIWKEFSLKLLAFIAKYKNDITWFLWGNHAQQIVNDLEISKKLTSSHPMMCYRNKDRDDDFLFGKINHFNETKDTINWKGIK